uniref:Uncharacterized protein n=1 Tax=Oreochromis aureus TaxID=47969 RepID=A0AAZ1X1U0_OREAU
MGESLCPSGSFLNIFKVARSSVKTILCKIKLFGFVTTLSRSGRRPKLLPSVERKLVKMLRNDAGITKSCYELPQNQHHFHSKVCFSSLWTRYRLKKRPLL